MKLRQAKKLLHRVCLAHLGVAAFRPMKVATWMAAARRLNKAGIDWMRAFLVAAGWTVVER